MTGPNPPARRRMVHDCVIDGAGVRHTVDVEVHEVREVALGTRYQGRRCDGSWIQWVEKRFSVPDVHCRSCDQGTRQAVTVVDGVMSSGVCGDCGATWEITTW